MMLVLFAMPLAWCLYPPVSMLNPRPSSLNVFTISPVSDSLFALMQGKSFAKGCTTKRDDLRYLKVLHYNELGKVQTGELVCNKAIAQDLIEIFEELYLQHYVIARMRLIDEYDGDDQKSMTANNTSCFNYRMVSGTKTVSKHGRGMAIDINPLYNPYVRVRNGKTIVEPASALSFATGREALKKKNTKGVQQVIDRSDLCYRLFIQHGFRWGGAWRSSKDYQHFEK